MLSILRNLSLTVLNQTVVCMFYFHCHFHLLKLIFVFYLFPEKTALDPHIFLFLRHHITEQSGIWPPAAEHKHKTKVDKEGKRSLLKCC